jgi:hypothetical protein
MSRETDNMLGSMRGPEAEARRDAEDTCRVRFHHLRNEGRSVTDAAMEALTMMLPRYRTEALVTSLSDGALMLTANGQVQRVHTGREKSPILGPEGVGR